MIEKIPGNPDSPLINEPLYKSILQPTFDAFKDVISGCYGLYKGRNEWTYYVEGFALKFTFQATRNPGSSSYFAQIEEIEISNSRGECQLVRSDGCGSISMDGKESSSVNFSSLQKLEELMESIKMLSHFGAIEGILGNCL